MNDTNPQEETLESIESAIKTHNLKIKEVSETLKKLNEMLNSYLDSSEEYLEAKSAAKDASAKKSSVKQKLLKKNESGQIDTKIKEARQTKKDLQTALSYYLAEYSRLSGSNVIEDENGDLKQIVYSARLVKRSGRS